MHNPFLIGSDVYLRPLEKSDAPSCARWFNDPEINRYTKQFLPISLHFEEEWLANRTANREEIVLGIVLTATDELIGSTGFHKVDYRNRHASFGIAIGVKEQWNKGHGTEATRLMVGYAFDALNVNRVWLHVYDFNKRGIRAYEKVGFKHEGILRQEAYREGRYHDTIVMGILREEWYALHPLPRQT